MSILAIQARSPRASRTVEFFLFEMRNMAEAISFGFHPLSQGECQNMAMQVMGVAAYMKSMRVLLQDLPKLTKALAYFEDVENPQAIKSFWSAPKERPSRSSQNRVLGSSLKVS